MSALKDRMRSSDYYASETSTNLSHQDMEKVQTLWQDIQQVSIPLRNSSLSNRFILEP